MDDARRSGIQVTPTRRLAHHLRARHDQQALAQGLAVWPTPDIVTWAGLIERMFRIDRQAGRTHRRWLSDGAARLAWERIVTRDPQAAAVIAPEGLAGTAHRAWRHLHDYRIPLASAEAVDGPEVAVFMRWASEFGAWIDQEGWIDAAGAQDWVDPAAAGTRLHFVGFDALTPGQSAFVDRMREGGVEVVVESEQTTESTACWVSVQDRETEVDMAARWAAARLDGAKDLAIAIVIPALAQSRAQIRRALDRVLVPAATLGGGPAPETQAYELAAARPLAEQPMVVAALEWLAAFTHDIDLARSSALLRNQFCRDAESEASARAALDARIRRDEAPDLALARLAALAARRACPGFAQALSSGLAAREAWPRAALPSHWAMCHFDLLQRIGWPGDGLDSVEHQVRQRWQDLFGEFGALDDVVGLVDSGAALGLLRDLADATLFEPQEIRAPLLVIDPETCAGMHFDALWVCGLDAGQWPAPMAPDPFLPRSWQVRRGVPGATPELTAAAAQRTLDRLRRSAREVVFSVPAFDDEAPLLPSSLLADVPQAPAPAVWDTPSLARSMFAARPEPIVTIDGTLPPVRDGERAPGGAKLLELQAACPFRAAAELRLGARALEEPSLGIDAATRGVLVHDLFAALWSDVRSSRAMHELPPGERVARVRAAIATGLAPLRRDANSVLAKLLDIEAQWLERRALELLAADLARPPFEVEHIETAHEVALGGLSLDLRVDRVDRLADGSSAVIDYKTGGNAQPRNWLDERPLQPQLPVYVEAYGAQRVSAVVFGRVRAGETGFAGLARDPAAFPGCKAPPREYAHWDDLLAAWHRRLEALAHEFATGDARLAPNPPVACRYCHLPSLCRIGEARIAGEDEGTEDE